MTNDWEIKKIGQVCLVIAGQSPEGKYYNTKSDGLPFYQGKKDFTDKYIGKPTKWTTKVTKEAVAGDILMSVRAPVGPVNFSTQKICIGRGLAVIRTSELIDKNFLFYFFIKHENDLVGNEGAVFNSINKSQIENIKVPKPSIPDQKRIVKILDKAFAAIDKAKANAEKNLQNSRELFDSYLNKIFANPCEDWKEKTFKEVCAKITDGTHQTPKYFDDGVVFLSSKNVTSGKINWDNIKYIDEKQHLEMHKRVAPRLNDILLAKNGTTGVAAMVDRDVVFDIYVSLAHIRVLDEVTPNYMLFFINSPVAKKQFNKRLKGSGVPNLHLEEIRKVAIPFPTSIKEQNIIVERLDTFSSKIKNLETICQQKLTNLEELKKSILQKAFDGQL
jgi:type I restriction enzyme, S subunit